MKFKVGDEIVPINPSGKKFLRRVITFVDDTAYTYSIARYGSFNATIIFIDDRYRLLTPLDEVLQ